MGSCRYCGNPNVSRYYSSNCVSCGAPMSYSSGYGSIIINDEEETKLRERLELPMRDPRGKPPRTLER